MPKIIYYDKNKKKNEFFKDFREISVVGSLNIGEIVFYGLPWISNLLTSY